MATDVFDEAADTSDIFDEVDAPPPLQPPADVVQSAKDAPLTPSQIQEGNEAERPQSLWETANTPLIKTFTGKGSAESLEGLGEMAATGSTLTPEQRAAQSAQDPKSVKAITGGAEGAADLADSFTSPIGIATLGIGGLPRAAQRVVSGLFATQMVSQIPGQAKEFKKATDEGDVGKASRLGVGILGGAAFTALGAKHALTPDVVPITPKPFVTPDELTPLVDKAKSILPKAAAETETVQPEEPDAQGIRSDESKPAPAGEVPKEGQAGGSGDLQQAPPEAPKPVGAREATPGEIPLSNRLDSPDTFKGKNWTKDALQYGAGLDPAKPEQLAELKQLEDAYKQKMAAIPKTVENFNEIAKVGNQKQWVTEAIQAAEGLSTRDIARETLGKDYKPPFPKEVTENAKEEKGKQKELLAEQGAGPGSPHVSEVPETGAGGEKYGVAERVREERSKAGQVAPVEPGKGIAPPDSVEHGRELLASGTNPEKVVSAFESTKRLSSDDMAVVRAHGEKLAANARLVEQKFGTKSPEFQEAFNALSDWDTRTKAMQTEWAKTGHAQQGETDLDTGSFTGLQRSHKETTDKDFTPEQAKAGEAIAKKVKTASDSAQEAQGKLFDHLDKEASGKKASDPQKAVWDKMKQYIAKGTDNFDDVRNKIATELGMKVDEVTKLMAQGKKAKALADDVWKKQQQARVLKEQAKRWVNAQSVPKYIKALRSIPAALFSLKVGFHGTVALGTHAPMVAFQPKFWKVYATDFGKMYKMVGSQTYYERQVQDLVRRPNYITARRAGLVNDPFTYEEYANVDFNDAVKRGIATISPKVAEFYNKLTGMGNRGYSVLKILRQDMFDQQWNQLPKEAQIPEVAQALADGLNHVTGVVKGKAPAGSNLVLFAPRLEASRVMWLAGDPIRSAKTFANWKSASLAERTFAMNQVKEKAWVAGTAFGLLALNQGMLLATGSKQKVNFDDPTKSDFLKFKVAGMDLSYGNAMLSMARLPIRLGALREKGGSGRMAKLIYPDESMSSEAFKYARTQFSPFAGDLADLIFKGDYENRPLPKMPLSGAQLPMPKRLAARGEKPYTWKELTLDKVLPIPAEEAVRDVWSKGLGMSDDQMLSYGKAFAKAMFMAGTGARTTEDRQPAQSAPPQQAALQPGESFGTPTQ